MDGASPGNVAKQSLGTGEHPLLDHDRLAGLGSARVLDRCLWSQQFCWRLTDGAAVLPGGRAEATLPQLVIREAGMAARRRALPTVFSCPLAISAL